MRASCPSYPCNFLCKRAKLRPRDCASARNRISDPLFPGKEGREKSGGGKKPAQKNSGGMIALRISSSFLVFSVFRRCLPLCNSFAHIVAKGRPSLTHIYYADDRFPFIFASSPQPPPKNRSKSNTVKCRMDREAADDADDRRRHETETPPASASALPTAKRIRFSLSFDLGKGFTPI